ncbi:MAG TPA: sugar phosphate nucleotidyltransferase [Pirellulales bacterium]|nr:sugar phosphate nucleotidyltransferase [Pirellulales bacterium]
MTPHPQSLPALPAAIILAGGRGTRLGSLYPNLPKPMIPAAGKPFIEWVLRRLAVQGLRRAMVSVGHLADVIEAYLDQRPTGGLDVQSVRETSALGTGGGARLAAQAVHDAEEFVVVNGDSLVLADLRGAWPLLDRDDVDGVVVGVQVDDAARYGTLDVGSGDRLTGFREKRPGSLSNTGGVINAGVLINAGVYFLKRRLLDALPADVSLSLETDAFPAWLAAGAKLLVLAVQGPFLDIGTPESVREAERFIQENVDGESFVHRHLSFVGGCHDDK